MTPPPATILSHPLPKTEVQGHLHVFGDRNSTHLVIMCAGYPDNQEALTPFAQRLANDLGCLVGITTPPGFDNAVAVSAYPANGFAFSDWGVAMKEAVKTLRGYSTRPPSETTLSGIFHDWGVFAGHIWANQTFAEGSKDLTPDRFVAVDVLLPRHPKGPMAPNEAEIKEYPKKQLAAMTYQLFLAGIYSLNRYFGPYFTLPFWYVGWKVLTFMKSFPLNQFDQNYIRDEIPDGTIQDLQRLFYMCYGYLQLWTLIFTGKIADLADLFCLPIDLSAIPVLFLDGVDKPVPLCNSKSLALLEEESAEGRPSRVVKVEGAGHWLLRQKPDESMKAITSFFQDTISSSSSE